MNEQMEKKLAELNDLSGEVAPIGIDEFHQRQKRCQEIMRENGLDAIYLHAGTNLYYFTGLQWNPSERMVAAILPAEGAPVYISPRFEIDTLKDYWQIEGEIFAWEEHECPFQLVKGILADQSLKLSLIHI